MSDYLALVEPYQRYLAYGVGGLILVAVYITMGDILRVVKYFAYKWGYQRGSGKAAIPGPLEDTRLTRFIDGSRLAPEYRQKYGPIYRIFCRGTAEVVLSDPEAIKIHYQGDAKFHYKQESAGFGFHMEHILGKAVGFANGEDWTRVRSCVDPHFSLDMAFALIPSMFGDTMEWLNTVPTSPTTVRDEKANRFIIPVEKFIPAFPLKMVARQVFGDVMDDKFYADLYEMSQVHDRIVDRIFFFKLQKYLPTKDNRDTEAFSKDWAKLLIGVSEECEKRGISTPVYEFYKNMKSGAVSFKEFAHTLDEILFGNITITTSAITWATCHIAQNPDIQNRLFQELSDALNDESLGATKDERRDSYVRKNNSLLHYCYLESARLDPIVSFALPDLTHDPKVIHGYYIPPRTPIVIDTYNLNRTSPVWGDDGHSFRPDRFEGLPATKYRYAFWRFGIGPRKCVGLNFGDKIVKVVLATIIENYEMRLKDNFFTENREMFFHGASGTMMLTPRDGRKI